MRSYGLRCGLRCLFNRKPIHTPDTLFTDTPKKRALCRPSRPSPAVARVACFSQSDSPPAPSMSLSRSPSPGPNGGWSSPGLTDYRDRSSSPRQKQYDGMNGYAATDAYWAAAKAKSDQVRGQPSFQTRNEGFFQRSRRKISSTLPRFNSFALDRRDWRDAEKLGRGRWNPHRGGEWSKIKTLVGNLLRRFKVLFVLLTIIATLTIIMSETSKWLRSTEPNEPR